ncbi:MAG: ParB/RepB/Spo0J family partition protein [Oscillospiraceae bacterium]|nr:ParB/RepB/Spo0J family partition protein [Oscillospiraceae bacterium]
MTNLPIDKLHPFEGHPYKVLDNEEMNDLISSIQESGILSPLLVRPLEETTDEYEVISGHRRLHAAQKAGLETVTAFIHAIDRDAASILLVDSNMHREHILPSEKAFAYKLKYEAMRHQGTSSQFGTKLRTDEQIAKESGESRNQIQRYIRLTHLGPKLLDLVDQGRIAFSVGVELSYLPDGAQKHLAEIIDRDEATPSYSQAVRMHRENRQGVESISHERIDEIMAEEKPNQREQIRLRRDEFSKYFPADYGDKQIKADILAGLDLLRRQRIRERNRDVR